MRLEIETKITNEQALKQLTIDSEMSNYFKIGVKASILDEDDDFYSRVQRTLNFINCLDICSWVLDKKELV